ncbi:PD-(D/E)XK nuclease family transposase, partial [Halomonas llamarensis]
GEDYEELRASVGLHLLDFDLFTESAAEREQAIWRFEMRDERQPKISLGNVLQMNLIELNKADRLGLPEGPLRAWITFFKHWQEELTMANVAHEPVKRAMSRIRELSADEETRRLAFVRERALRDEVSFLNDAKREGEKLGIEKGRQETLQEAEERVKEAEYRALESKRNAARKLIARTEMDDQAIAEIEELPVEDVEKLRGETQH